MLIRRKVHLVLILLSVIYTYHVIAISNLKARATSEPTPKIIGIENDHYIDEFGRQRFFRGLNVVCKDLHPYDIQRKKNYIKQYISIFIKKNV